MARAAGRFDYRVRPRGLEVKPGSVRKARLDAGLSLSALGGTAVSKTALSLIELGRTRPTLPTLQLIAARTDKPLSYFLKPGQEDLVTSQSADAFAYELDQLEQLVASGEWQRGLHAYQALREEQVDEASRAWLEVLGGQVQVCLGDPAAAEPGLRAAAGFFGRKGDVLRHAEALDWLAGALQALQDPLSLETALQALSICRSADGAPTSLELRILNRLGGIYVAQNRWEDAVRSYERAVALSGETRDLGRMARAYNGLSIAYQSLGNLSDARKYAQRAIALHETLRDNVSAASAENNLGLVLMQLGRRHEARQHLLRSLDLCDAGGIEQGRSYVLLSLAELALTEEDYESAAEAAERGLAQAQALNERTNIAVAHELLGTIAARQGKSLTVIRRHFETAIGVVDQMAVPSRVTEAHAKYARILEERGLKDEAAVHWRQAVAAEHPDLVTASADRADSSDRAARTG